MINIFFFLTCCRVIRLDATTQVPLNKAKKGSQSFGSPRARLSHVASVNFADTTDSIQASWSHRWAYMYEYIDTATQTAKFPPQAVRDSDDSEAEEEVYNEELLRLQRSTLR